MDMSRFKITQGIIKEGIDKKIEELQALVEQKVLLAEKPETAFFGDFDEEKARNITAAKLKDDSRFTYMEKIKKAIYIVSAPDFPFSWEYINDDNGPFKNLKETIALPRISGKSHWDDQKGKKSKCLYVGSSHSIASRVIQHFWKCAKGTYALHLIEWDWWDKKNEAQIDIWDASEISDNHLLIIEDIVWIKYKPLFGRPGAK
jgi:hypothetical protein